jgi:hypothetical protein
MENILNFLQQQGIQVNADSLKDTAEKCINLQSEGFSVQSLQLIVQTFGENGVKGSTAKKLNGLTRDLMLQCLSFLPADDMLERTAYFNEVSHRPNKSFMTNLKKRTRKGDFETLTLVTLVQHVPGRMEVIINGFSHDMTKNAFHGTCRNYFPSEIARKLTGVMYDSPEFKTFAK